MYQHLATIVWGVIEGYNIAFAAIRLLCRLFSGRSWLSLIVSACYFAVSWLINAMVPHLSCSRVNLLCQLALHKSIWRVNEFFAFLAFICIWSHAFLFDFCKHVSMQLSKFSDSLAKLGQEG